jgi:NAD(P)-dependent dehydrogenase (short-subunit alcohol dehydrogenase family)
VVREGQRIIVTSGTSGIGRAVARLLAGQGAEVIVASSDQRKVSATGTELGARGRDAPVDVTDEESVSGFFKQTGAFDHLIYTAGAALDLMTVPEVDLDAARHCYEVRCFGILRAVKHATGAVRAGGSSTFTSGIAGARPASGWAVAAGTAGTIEAFTRALAVELAPVRVNAVSPGTVRTPLWSALPEADREVYYGRIAETNLTGTIGIPEELAAAYAFLIDQPSRPERSLL